MPVSLKLENNYNTELFRDTHTHTNTHMYTEYVTLLTYLLTYLLHGAGSFLRS